MADGQGLGFRQAQPVISGRCKPAGSLVRCYPVLKVQDIRITVPIGWELERKQGHTISDCSCKPGWKGAPTSVGTRGHHQAPAASPGSGCRQVWVGLRLASESSSHLLTASKATYSFYLLLLGRAFPSQRWPSRGRDHKSLQVKPPVNTFTAFIQLPRPPQSSSSTILSTSTTHTQFTERWPFMH